MTLESGATPAEHRISTELDIVDIDDVIAEPWRNGLGWTRVIYENDVWRLSVAELSGTAAFSVMPGLDRRLVVATDGLLELSLRDDIVRVGRDESLAFAGEEPVVARTESGGMRVVNLIWSRAHAVANFELRREHGVSEAEDASHETNHDRLLVLLRGRASINDRPLRPLSAVRGGTISRLTQCHNAVFAQFDVARTPEGVLR